MSPRVRPRPTAAALLAACTLIAASPADASPPAHHFSGSGVLTVLENEGSAPDTYVIEHGEQMTPVAADPSMAGLVGEHVRLEDGAVVAASADSADGGSESVLVIKVRYHNRPDSLPASATDTSITNALARTRSYYSLQTGGALQISTDVVPNWIVGAEDWTGSCRDKSLTDDGLAGARAQGFEPTDYTRVSFVIADAGTNDAGQCDVGGLGLIGGSYTWLYGNGNSRKFIHELGHNFGALHANSLACTQDGLSVSLSSSCTSTEYGDPFDIMGGKGLSQIGGPLFSTWHRDKVGQLTGYQTTVTQTGAVTLDGSDTTGQSSLLIPRKIPGQALTQWFALEKRNLQGPNEYFALGDPVTTGVTLRLVGYSTAHDSDLLDMHPATPDLKDAPLAAGESFTDAASGVKIDVATVTSSAANLVVTFPAPPAPPAPPIVVATAPAAQPKTIPAPVAPTPKPAPTPTPTPKAASAPRDITAPSISGGRLLIGRFFRVNVSDAHAKTVTIFVGSRAVAGQSIRLSRAQLRRSVITVIATDAAGNTRTVRYRVVRGRLRQIR